MAVFDQDALNDAIHDWIAASLPMITPSASAIRWANQYPPAGDPPFALLNWEQAPAPMGRTVAPEKRVHDTGGDVWAAEYTHRPRMFLSIDVTTAAVRGSGSAPALLRAMLDAQAGAAVTVFLDALPAVVLRFEPAVDLSALVADQFRSRARIRAEIYSKTTTTETGDYIAAGVFTATVD